MHLTLLKYSLKISNEFTEANTPKSPLPATYIFFTYCNCIFPFNEGQYCVYWENKMFIQILKQFCTKRFQVSTHIDQAWKVKNVNPELNWGVQIQTIELNSNLRVSNVSWPSWVISQWTTEMGHTWMTTLWHQQICSSVSHCLIDKKRNN